MHVELVSPTIWDLVREQVDSDFGRGATSHLLHGEAPVMMKRGDALSIYLIPMDWTGILEMNSGDFELHYLGVWLGEIIHDRFRLSLAALNRLMGFTASVLEVSEQGAQSFTYGKSILKESVVRVDSRLKRNQRVIVVNRMRECLGLAALSVDADRIGRLAPDRLVARNLVDIGWYVRRLG